MRTQIVKFLFGAGVVALALTACQKEAQPVLELSQTEVSVTADGGSASVAYRLTNPVAGASVTAATEADWVSNIKVDASTISFDVAASTVLESRTAEVTVSYPGIPSVSFNIVQGAYDPDFLFEILGTTASTITFSVTPKDPEMYYVLSCYTEEEMEEYGYDSDEAIIADEMDLYSLLLDYGYTWDDLAYVGTQESLTYHNLPANSDCVLFAYGVDITTATPCTGIFYAYASTTEAEPSDMTIDITVSDISARSAVVTITPSNEEESYAAIVEYAEDIEGQSDEELLSYYIENGYLDDPLSGTYEEKVVGLDPMTEFVVLAFGCDGGVPTTGLFKTSFTTPEAVLGDVTLTVENGAYYDLYALDELYPEIGFASYADYYGLNCLLYLHATTSEPVEEYYYTVYTKEEVDEILEGYGEDFLATYTQAYGVSETPLEMMMPYDFECVNVGFAVDENGNWGPLFISEPYTISAEGASDASEYDGMYAQLSTKSAGIGIKTVTSFEKGKSIFVRERTEAPALKTKFISRNPAELLK